MADAVAAAWQRIATEIAVRLPGTWGVRRRGARTRLVREPIEWTLQSIGFGRIRGRDDGDVYASVIPLVQPFEWIVAYGLQMGDGQPKDYEIPRGLRVLEPDAVDVLLRFLDRQGLPTIEDWPAQRLADVAERSYRLPADQRRASAVHWTQVAGWRVVNGTGSPVEPARDAVAYLRGLHDTAEQADWYRQLIAAWESGGRAAALDFLVGYKQQVLTREKLLG